MKTEGWGQLVEPILDKMIEDVIGGKQGKIWNSGSFGDKRLGELRADRLIWYRQALIEFNNHLHSIIEAGKSATKRLTLAAEAETMPFQTPMVDSPYAQGEMNKYSSYEQDPDGDGGTHG